MRRVRMVGRLSRFMAGARGGPIATDAIRSWRQHCGVLVPPEDMSIEFCCETAPDVASCTGAISRRERAQIWRPTLRRCGCRLPHLPAKKSFRRQFIELPGTRLGRLEIQQAPSRT